MNLIKLPPADERYQRQFQNIDVQHFNVYVGHAAIGKVSEVLLDEAQNCYLLIEAGSWLSRKQMILPLRQFQIAPAQHQIHLPEGTQPITSELSSEQFQSKHMATGVVPPIELSAPLESSAPLEFPVVTRQEVAVRHLEEPATANVPLNAASSHSGSIPAPLPADSALTEAEIIQLLEERLVVNRQWRKAGEVVIRKIIDTRLVEVPVRREKLVVEQISPDRRQLASIELPLSSDSAVLNPPVDAEEMHHVGISITTAHRILEKLQESPELKQTRVKMQFENSNLQSQYQDWLKEHFSHSTLI